MAFIAYIVLCSGAILASVYIHFSEKERDELTFAKYTSNVHQAIQGRMDYYKNALSQTAAMLMDERDLTADAFHEYTNNVGIKENYPGMTAMGYAQLVSSENLEGFISKMREQGSENFEVWPENLNRQVYAPVKTVSPFDTIIKPLQGFDLLSEESRAVPMLEAAIDGKPTLTKEVELFTKEGIRADGFNLFYPVYSSAIIPSRKEQRSLLKKGYVFGIFHTERLFNTILKEQTNFSRFLSVTIFFKGSGSPSKIYDSFENKDGHQPKFQILNELSLANRDIAITYKSTPSFEQDISSNLTWIILLIGLTFSTLLYYLARKVLKSRRELQINER
ncbi:MAG: CHASE domain-containing protein, partial [Bacteriovoracaceae bacterium]|nr:CHASE domain-containing protein [Bacteriovoracaceae bacterium]